MWWLCFQRDGRLLGVAIVKASSLIAARMQASLAELGRSGIFTEGHALDAACRALIAPDLSLVPCPYQKLDSTISVVQATQNGVSLSKIRSGRIGDAIRLGLASTECARRPGQRAVSEHPCSVISVCALR
jgi:hypothetical protein